MISEINNRKFRWILEEDSFSSPLHIAVWPIWKGSPTKPSILSGKYLRCGFSVSFYLLHVLSKGAGVANLMGKSLMPCGLSPVS